ncbi:MAG: efflux RND transporter periplasmic adaptor subunit [Candidatus Brocadia sp. AMX2]|uniref:HlyD family secretion protein n=1 Tax=Candidatus Brocadia sinica JPN1 TaxID=1197129 RepID=A0ABQ0K0I4_9BACT|nr:MAG: efflux RND transporter periplasmic adaptor subunit [Candidatus Brocadia sp. AMX2]MBC6932719.1 efflux RND transporter periplasmic adaptor subunit [Candidatus Brocadia sp.]MBL1169955.1 efflux RND transporter periplasmic adaptor subunit [Candidatus Brocadia sp. AMX1]MCK6469567.1 efflux RND transporter periplasmic adaptor subunit [Candidatus Brocadia sinica]GAN34562.1 HlyD family secretion protein [Candidatus Brocadia sinica JPN1]
MKKYVIIGIPCLVAIIVASIYFLGNSESIQYKTEKIDRGSISKYVTATGTINPVRTVIIGSQVTGLISRLYADFNSAVKVGQVVAQIDPVPFEHRVKQAEATLATAIASLEKAKVNSKNNRRNYHRSKKLFAKKVVSIEELDAARTTYEAGLADVKLAEAQVLQAKAALGIAKTDLEHTVIISPLNGIVISRNVDVGQTVVSSFQTPILFNIAEDLVHMQVNTNVDEADIGMVQVGQDAKFTVDAFPEDLFEGKVSEIRMAPIIFQNVVTYDTIINVDNTSLKLKPGMTANTSILVARVENVLRVPNVALRYTPSEILKGEGDKKALVDRKFARKTSLHIWVLERGKLKQVAVKPGIGDDGFTEILEGDVKEGQEVVIGETLPKTAEKGQQRVPWGRARY